MIVYVFPSTFFLARHFFPSVLNGSWAQVPAVPPAAAGDAEVEEAHRWRCG